MPKFQIRLTDERYQTLKQAAEDRGTGMSQIVNEMIDSLPPDITPLAQEPRSAPKPPKKAEGCPQHPDAGRTVQRGRTWCAELGCSHIFS